jgi:hypothetical protein
MESLAHRETLADVYVREDGSAVVHDFSPRINGWFMFLTCWPLAGTLAYFPLCAAAGWEIAYFGIAFSALGPFLARRVPRHVRGPKRAERIFPAKAG